jgi:hypothetical protein
MFILGGFDGKRQNDMHTIKLGQNLDMEFPSRPTSTYSSSIELDDADANQPSYEELAKLNSRLQ